MSKYEIYREWTNGYKEIKTVQAKSLKDAWLNNVDAPVPKRNQNYKGTDRSGSYYYGGWVDGVWTLVQKAEGLSDD